MTETKFKVRSKIIDDLTAENVRLLAEREELIGALKDMVDVGWTGGMSHGGHSSEEQGALDCASALLTRLESPNG